MATYQSVNTVLALSGPTASGGIAGGPQFPRATGAAGKLQIGVDSYVTLGSELAGAIIDWWPQIPATARIVYAMLSWGAMGASATLTLGKTDPNNSANTDAAHYLAAQDASVSASALANLNIGEQVGQDPLGDDSTGNVAPGFGALPIILTSTTAGATLAASQNIVLVYFFVSGT